MPCIKRKVTKCTTDPANTRPRAGQHTHIYPFKQRECFCEPGMQFTKEKLYHSARV